jgi:hypothetical protein
MFLARMILDREMLLLYQNKTIQHLLLIILLQKLLGALFTWPLTSHHQLILRICLELGCMVLIRKIKPIPELVCVPHYDTTCAQWLSFNGLGSTPFLHIIHLATHWTCGLSTADTSAADQGQRVQLFENGSTAFCWRFDKGLTCCCKCTSCFFYI